MKKSHKITGGGGVQLQLVETGNSKGRSIMFIHGFSQCWPAWSRQMSSDLADDYRLVAMDMRVMAFQISLARATMTRNCGLMTSTRPYRLWDWIIRSSVVGHMDHLSSSTILGITARIASAVSTSSVPLRSSVVTRRCRFSRLSFSASYQVSLPRM